MTKYLVVEAGGEKSLIEATRMEIDSDRSRTTLYNGDDVVFSGVGVRSAGVYSPMPEPTPAPVIPPSTPDDV
jgi:hypothetical protein